MTQVDMALMVHSVAIAVIGPEVLRDGFTVLLRSARREALLVYATTLDALRVLAKGISLNLIIIHVAGSDQRCRPGQILMSEIPQVLSEWPQVPTIALVDDPQLAEMVEDLDVDLGLLDGTMPARLLQGIDVLLAGQ